MLDRLRVGGVAQPHLLELESGEGLAHLGAVVEREDEAALEAAKDAGHPGKVLAREDAVAVVSFMPPVGRVDVEQGEGAVVAADEGGPVQALDMDTLEPGVGAAHQLTHPHAGEPGRVMRGRRVLARRRRGRRLAAEGQPLDVDETGGALNIGQRLRRHLEQAAKLAARGNHPVELAREFVGVLAGNPEQVDDVAVDVVENLAPGPLATAQEDARHAAEGLGVAAVRHRLDALGDAARKQPLAAEPGRDGIGRLDVPERFRRA